jgi:ArsR family metal-binding transcriptional regulator
MNRQPSGLHESLIRRFDLEMVSPPCVPGSEHWSGEARLDTDITEVLPYLNTCFPEASYDRAAQVLLMKWEGKKCAFRPRLISVAPVRDREEASRRLDELAGLVNETWRNRNSIEPSYTQKTMPTVMELYRLLPRTNCKKCGYVTCMAFSADLREGKIELSCCPELSLEGHARNREALEALLSTDSL